MLRSALLAGTAALVALLVPAMAQQVRAAPTKSPYCNMARSQKNPMAWDEYYHCFGQAPEPAARPALHMEVRSATPAKSPYCNMARSQKNPMAWDEYYHCFSR